LEAKKYLNEVGLLRVTAYDHSVDLGLETLLLVLIIVYEPFRQAGASSPILQKDETDLNQNQSTMYGGFEL
jgi:hypothetical protein